MARPAGTRLKPRSVILRTGEAFKATSTNNNTVLSQKMSLKEDVGKHQAGKGLEK